MLWHPSNCSTEITLIYTLAGEMHEKFKGSQKKKKTKQKGAASMGCAEVLTTSFQEALVQVPLFQELCYLLNFLWALYHVIT